MHQRIYVSSVLIGTTLIKLLKHVHLYLLVTLLSIKYLTIKLIHVNSVNLLAVSNADRLFNSNSTTLSWMSCKLEEEKDH